MSSPTLEQALATGSTKEEWEELNKPVKTRDEIRMERMEAAPLIVCGMYRGLDGRERHSCYVLVDGEMTHGFEASEHGAVRLYCLEHPEKRTRRRALRLHLPR